MICLYGAEWRFMTVLFIREFKETGRIYTEQILCGDKTGSWVRLPLRCHVYFREVNKLLTIYYKVVSDNY